MRKIFIALLALFFVIGISSNNALADRTDVKKGVKIKYKGGSVSGGGASPNLKQGQTSLLCRL